MTIKECLQPYENDIVYITIFNNGIPVIEDKDYTSQIESIYGDSEVIRLDSVEYLGYMTLYDDLLNCYVCEPDDVWSITLTIEGGDLE